jgi:hypothetical protein
VGDQIFGRARSESSIALKGSNNNSPRPTTAKEKPTGLKWRV